MKKAGKTDPQKLICESGVVPSLPIIYARINKAVNDPTSSMTSIGEIISKDMGLSARLLRMANSAFYNFPSRIDTISQAVIVIGIEQIRDLALGTSVIELFEGIPRHLVSMESFWRHSMTCGLTARMLAVHRREINVERYFVAGLLHDIGRLIIYMKIPGQASEALSRCKTTGEFLYQAEREIMGFHHAEVGGALMQYWKLPATLTEAVAFHHHPLDSNHSSVDASTIHVADIIANAMELGSSGERCIPSLVPEAWEQLGLSTSVLEPTLNEVDRQFHDIIEVFLEPVSKLLP